MNAINIAAARRRNKVVILKSFNLESKLLTRRSLSMADVARALKSIYAFIFGARMSALVAALCICAIWWHNITIMAPDAAGVAVATDCLCALPWAIVWVCRETFSEKGGKK